MEHSERFELIREWAEARGLYAKGDVKTQYCKLGEEFGELGRSIIKDEHDELVDAIGDIVVVLTNLAHLAGVKIEDCIDSAYNEIKNRTGSMQNGSFVKNEQVIEKNSREEITESQVKNFFVRKCIDDYQFDKKDDRYCGFINMDPSTFDSEDYDICLFIINNKAKSENIANSLGLTIETASADELIIIEKSRYYKCVGLKENACKIWKWHFIIGKTYKEKIGIYAPKYSLCLISDCGREFFVDEDQFEFLHF